MSQGSERKLNKIVQVLANERERKVAALMNATQQEEAAARLYQEAIEREACARESWAQQVPGLRAADWEQEAAWRLHLGNVRESAAESYQQARLGVESAREKVKESHSRVRRIEVLLDRMAESRRIEETRHERKAEDDWVTSNLTQSPSSSD